MNKNEQISAIKNALVQFGQIADIEQELSILKSKSYSKKPLPPTLEEIPDPEYPIIKTDTKFLSWKLLPALIFWPWIIIYFFKFYIKEDETAQEKVRNSPEYRAQCEKLDEETNSKRKYAEEKYQKDLKEYNNVTLPKWQKEYGEWVKNHTATVSEAEDRLLGAKNKLQDILTSLDEIPVEYKEAPILSYILHIISNTNKTIQEAVNIYACRHIFTECPNELCQSMRWYGTGDEAINRFIDSVIGDLNAKLPEIPDIYGGTNQSKWYKQNDACESTYPNILVKYDMEFVIYDYEFGTNYYRNLYYKNITEYGQEIEHSCTTSEWSVKLKPYLLVFTRSKEENNAIVQKIKDAYSDKACIETYTPIHNDERCLIELSYSSASEMQEFQNGTVYRTCIYFNSFYGFYNIGDYTKERIGSDQMLQVSLYNQAIHINSLLHLSRKYEENLELMFAKLIDGTEVSTKLLSFESQRFRELKRCYNEGKSLDKVKFYEEFYDILKYYPRLYDRTIQGCTIEQIKADILNEREIYSKRLKNIYAVLNIPENIIESQSGLNYLAESLSNSYCTMSEAIQTANEKIQADIQRDAERDAQAEEFWNNMKERHDARRESARRVAETAAGTYIGNRMADKKRQKEASKEFKWTKFVCSPSCPYRGKGYGPTRCKRDPSTCGHGVGYS